MDICEITEPEGIICPVVEHVGSSTLSPNGSRTTRTYWIHHAKTLDDAEAIACLKIPQRLPGKKIVGPALQVKNACGECEDEFFENPEEDTTRCTWPNRYLSNLDIRAGKEQSKGHWKVIATYEGCIEDDFELSFSDSGGTKNIKYAPLVETCPPDACSFGNAINVSHDGSIEGCDIPDQGGTFELTKCYPPGFMTCERYAFLMGVRGCVNDSGWGPNEGSAGSPNCFDVEQLQFVGASGNVPRFGVQRITFKFVYAPDFDLTLALSNGDSITKTIKGHHKHWVRSERGFDEQCGWEITLPEAVYVHRPLGLCDFGATFSEFNFPP